jgi:hypothetical protein
MKVRRREFITLLGGAAAAWPVAVRAQPGERVRRVGVLLGGDEGDQTAKNNFVPQGLAELGWTDGRNLRLDVRWAAGNLGRMQMFATELVDLKPGVMFVTTPAGTKALPRPVAPRRCWPQRRRPRRSRSSLRRGAIRSRLDLWTASTGRAAMSRA